MELTLAIFKPHLVKNPLAMAAVRKMIHENNIQIVKHAETHLTEESAAQFYAEHLKKFFYHRLQTFICSGPVEVAILAGDNVIANWRTLLGPTKVYKTIYSHPHSIRGRFGLSDTRNACHGSDSRESASREIKMFFPDFDYDQWVKKSSKVRTMKCLNGLENSSSILKTYRQ